jgi:DNA polymerase-4
LKNNIAYDKIFIGEIMERVIMHIDVNNAFLSWTAVYLLNNGSKYDIRNSYAVIGGDEKARRGIVLAKSMPAKKLGVVTGETLYSARKKCPVLKAYPMNYPFYQEMSNKLFNLIRKYSPDIEIASIDECYLDYTKVKNLYGEPYEFALKLKKEVNETLGFTINIGIANNKLCAKMASDFSKPNKIHTLYMNEIEEKMWPLKVGELFGIGKKTKEKLEKININTIYDLAHADQKKLYPYFKNQAKSMIDWANGIDNSEVISDIIAPKGISNEITLDHDISDKTKLQEYLLFLSEKVGIRIRKENKYAYVVAVIIKDKYFKRRTHQKKLDKPISLSKDIYEVSKEILNEMWNEDSVRLIGIRLDKLTEKRVIQASLFDTIDNEVKDTTLEKTLDNLKDKFGVSVIKRASLKNKKDVKK